MTHLQTYIKLPCRQASSSFSRTLNAPIPKEVFSFFQAGKLMSSIFGMDQKIPLWRWQSLHQHQNFKETPHWELRGAKVRLIGLISLLTVGERKRERRKEQSTWLGEVCPAGGRYFPERSQNRPSPWAAQCPPYSPCPHDTVADLQPYPAQRQWQTFRPAAAGHILGRFLQPLGWVSTLSRGGNKPCLPHSLLFLENSWQTELSKYSMSPTYQ